MATTINLQLASDDDRLLVEAEEVSREKARIANESIGTNVVFGCGHCDKRFKKSEMFKEHLPNQ
jgi:hypothetical protein